jgi:hypothetical protein
MSGRESLLYDSGREGIVLMDGAVERGKKLRALEVWDCKQLKVPVK